MVETLPSKLQAVCFLPCSHVTEREREKEDANYSSIKKEEGKGEGGRRKGARANSLVSLFIRAVILL